MKKATKAKTSSASKPVVKETSPPAATPSEAQRLAATILEMPGGACVRRRRRRRAIGHLAAALLPARSAGLGRLGGGAGAASPRESSPPWNSASNSWKNSSKRLVAQCARQEALVRRHAAQLGAGGARQTEATGASAPDGKRRKSRKPMVRALQGGASRCDAQAEARRWQFRSVCVTTNGAERRRGGGLPMIGESDEQGDDSHGGTQTLGSGAGGAPGRLDECQGTFGTDPGDDRRDR